ncbi:MAG: hypothetical protein QXY52_02460 [Conexivisphaerales archaeon]
MISHHSNERGKKITIGLGAIIGAGIFVLSGTAKALTGFSIISFIIVGSL